MAEWDGLENRCGGNPTEGSNPSLSELLKGFTSVCVIAGQKIDFRFLHIPGYVYSIYLSDLRFRFF